MARLVPDEGFKHARIALVGESPGSYETRLGRPFVGPSGYKLEEWWRSVGLDRKDFFITNVYPYQPKANKIETVPKDELETWVTDLHQRIAQLDDPWLIVPTGNTALRALTGKKGIGKHRGSIYEYVDLNGRKIKCIPTIHPAATFREPWYERPCRADWKRIAGDSKFRDLRLPERTHITGRDLRAYEDFYNEAKEKATILAIDIETTPDIVLCVGFSFDPSFSITIPVDSLGYGDDPMAVRQAWDITRRLCELPCEKTLQNGSYDTFRLASYKIAIRNYKWDTLALHHTLDPSDAHDLAYMASIDTRQPYWKDEAKDPDESAKYASNIDALWTYNGIDCCVQRELTDIYIDRLKNAGLVDFYERHYRRMFAPILRTMLNGIALDNKARARKHVKLTARCIGYQDKLTAIAGEPLYGKKDLSNKKLQRFLYETLRLPKQYAKNPKGEKVVTAREVAVRRLMLKFPDKLNEAGQLILDHRRDSTLSKFLGDNRVDPDGRLRFTLKMTTEAGRLASSKNPNGRGSNVQNQDREIRNIFVPDRGHVFMSVDLSQAENRVVNVLTGDPELIARAKSKPWEFDEHTTNAMALFKVKREEVDYLKRYLGKRTVHGAQRGLRGKKLSDEVLKDGFVIAPEECDAMIDEYLRLNPAISKWHQRVRITVLRERRVVNSWGRELRFEHERMSDDLYRRAYSFYPQSEVADLLNQYGFIPLHYYIYGRKLNAKIGAQVHDELLVSTAPEHAYELAIFLKDALETPRKIGNEELSIPVEVKLGRTWKHYVEYKVMPSEEEFTEKANELCRRS